MRVDWIRIIVRTEVLETDRHPTQTQVWSLQYLEQGDERCTS